MMDLWIVGILTGILIFQQIQIQKLVNKLMSRNYHEYIQSEKSVKNALKAPELKEDLDAPEDLRILQDFQL